MGAWKEEEEEKCTLGDVCATRYKRVWVCCVRLGSMGNPCRLCCLIHFPRALQEADSEAANPGQRLRELREAEAEMSSGTESSEPVEKAPTKKRLASTAKGVSSAKKKAKTSTAEPKKAPTGGKGAVEKNSVPKKGASTGFSLFCEEKRAEVTLALSLGAFVNM